MSNCFLYALKDPRTGRFYYVGATTVGMVRPRKHATPSCLARCHNPRLRAWVSSLPARPGRQRPYDIVTLKEFTSRDTLWELIDGKYPEQYEIERLLRLGEPLTNISIGSPVTCTPRERRRAAYGSRNGASTHPEQIRRGELHGCAKLTDAIVLSCRSRRKAGESNLSLAREFGVTATTMCAATTGKHWKHLNA